jgi:2-polyprenyl-3-methyl-5-hydroxy-6-metoxy-1,4-benzoquinol methylase
MAEVIKKQLESRGFLLDKKSVLDIGCFTADFIEILSQYGCDVYGLELQK